MAESHKVFAKVDDLVKKPVLGSDGALAWQNFRSSGNLPRSSSTAPNLPMKKLDRVGMGVKSIHDERNLENKIRQKSGESLMGSGYTEFKRKHNEEERISAKQKQKILDRIRPDNLRYFIASKTFDGWKKDYIFTTRKSYGTGYFWDGMDSKREVLDDGTKISDNNKSISLDKDEIAKKKKKKKKEKTHQKTATASLPTTNNPMEQVANAIARRNAALSTAMPNAVAPAVSSHWSSAIDPSSGKTYYYNAVTKETKWDNPLGESDASSGGLGNDQRKRDVGDDDNLPPGWKICRDSATGKEYYYHDNGKTCWDRPVV